MRQLAFKLDNSTNDHAPDFETWFYENSKERRMWGEKPHNREKAKEIYNSLLKNNFFSEE